MNVQPFHDDDGIRPSLVIDATRCDTCCSVSIGRKQEKWRSVERLFGFYFLNNFHQGGGPTFHLCNSGFVGFIS